MIETKTISIIPYLHPKLIGRTIICALTHGNIICCFPNNPSHQRKSNLVDTVCMMVGATHNTIKIVFKRNNIFNRDSHKQISI